MKPRHILAIFGLAAALTGCADLGLGVDVDSGAYSPYWYGNGYLGNTYWDTPVWNYGPIYNQIPPRPIINNPIIVVPNNRPNTPPPQNRPQAPVVGNPGATSGRVPSQINGIQRPGNGGQPNPEGVTGRPAGR